MEGSRTRSCYGRPRPQPYRQILSRPHSSCIRFRRASGPSFRSEDACKHGSVCGYLALILISIGKTWRKWVDRRTPSPPVLRRISPGSSPKKPAGRMTALRGRLASRIVDDMRAVAGRSESAASCRPQFYLLAGHIFEHSPGEGVAGGRRWAKE